MKHLRTISILFVLLGLLVAALFAVPASMVTMVSAEPAPINSGLNEPSYQEGTPYDPSSYWTPGKMLSAIPYDIVPDSTSPHAVSPNTVTQVAGAPGWTPSVPPDGANLPIVTGQAGTVPPPAPTSDNVTDYVPRIDYTQFPYSASGKVFFTKGPIPFVCSAAVIGENTVWTAGHCVNDGAGNFHTNWIFVPAFYNFTAPYPYPYIGDYAITPSAWTNSADARYDYAIVHVQLPAPNGESLRHYSGALGFAWNLPRQQEWKVLGYPTNYNGGFQMVYSDSTYFTDAPDFANPKPVGVGSQIKNGGSGGSWMLNFRAGAAGQANYLNGTSSFYNGSTYPDLPPDLIFSPYFGDRAKRLWDCAQNSTLVQIKCVDANLNTRLLLTQSASSNPVQQGAQFTYTLTVQNHGPGNATQVILTDRLPAQVSFVSATLPGGNCVLNGGVVTCNLDILPKGRTATATLTVTAPGYDTSLTNIVDFNFDQGEWSYHSTSSTQVGDTNPCAATHLTVANMNESGAGSLRQSLADICPGGTVDFAPGLSGGTIHLASPLAASDVTIDGSALAEQITLSGDTDGDDAGDTRVFNTSGNVTLNSLTITKGYSNELTNGDPSASGGGGIYNPTGALTLINCTISENSTLYNGGGIWGTAKITNSTLFSNSAVGNGGGIYSVGGLELTNSTLSENSATGNGGGIYGVGGTLLNGDTLSGNSAAGNGGGIYVTMASGDIANSVNIANTLIANSPSGGDCYNDGSRITANRSNLVMDGTCSTGGVNFETGDPVLGPLADNGGPTRTMALLPRSPAIDAGDDATCTTFPLSNRDQRGLPRPEGAHCDIGAFEADTTSPILINPLNAEILHFNRPTFDWFDSLGVIGYNIQISKNVGFTQLVSNTNLTGGTNSTYTPTTNLTANVDMWWRVRAKLTATTYSGWSEVRLFHTANPPSVPTLIAPANNALVTTTPLLDWNDVTVPSGTTFRGYNFQISTDSAFGFLWSDASTGSLSQYTPLPLPSGAKYYWRIRSCNIGPDGIGYSADDQCSAWSTARYFRVAFAAPTLTAPANGATLIPLKPTFTWTAITGATTYTLQVSKSNTFNLLVINKTFNVLTYTHTMNLTANTTYYWRVRANGPYGPGAWSVTFSFTTTP